MKVKIIFSVLIIGMISVSIKGLSYGKNNDDSLTIIGESLKEPTNVLEGKSYKVKCTLLEDYGEYFLGEDNKIYYVIDPPELLKGDKVIIKVDDHNTYNTNDDTVCGIVELSL